MTEFVECEIEEATHIRVGEQMLPINGEGNHAILKANGIEIKAILESGAMTVYVPYERVKQLKVCTMKQVGGEIDTAPKDGSRILVIDINAQEPQWEVCRWDNEKKKFMVDEDSYFNSPTHWGALPSFLAIARKDSMQKRLEEKK